MFTAFVYGKPQSLAMDGGDWLVIPEVNPQKSPWML